MLLWRGRVRYFAPTDMRCVKAPKIRLVQHNSFFDHHRSVWTRHGWWRRFGVVNPSGVDGCRGDYGHHCPLLFCVVVDSKILWVAGEAGKLMEQGLWQKWQWRDPARPPHRNVSLWALHARLVIQYSRPLSHCSYQDDKIKIVYKEASPASSSSSKSEQAHTQAYSQAQAN